MKLLLFICGSFFSLSLAAQPFLDVASYKYQDSPEGQTGKPGTNSFRYANLSLNLPMIFKKDSSMIVFSPYGEQWRVNAAAVGILPDHLQSLVLPVTFIKPLNKKWTMTLSAIPRWNGPSGAVFKQNFQMGGAVLAAYKVRPGLQYTFGLYYNSEFSGPFFMPLLGIDWKINAKDNLFGVLPGNLVFEHKVSKQFYWGATFRSVTNSYADGYIGYSLIRKYLRIQDTQLDVFGDVYLTKNIVFSLAAGHSVARKYREGSIEQGKPYITDAAMDAGFYARIALIYRIRFR